MIQPAGAQRTQRRREHQKLSGSFEHSSRPGNQLDDFITSDSVNHLVPAVSTTVSRRLAGGAEGNIRWLNSGSQVNLTWLAGRPPGQALCGPAAVATAQARAAGKPGRLLVRRCWRQRGRRAESPMTTESSSAYLLSFLLRPGCQCSRAVSAVRGGGGAPLPSSSDVDGGRGAEGTAPSLVRPTLTQAVCG